MKCLSVVSFFGLAALFGLPAGAQTVATPPPAAQLFQQPEPAPPQGQLRPSQDPEDWAPNQVQDQIQDPIQDQAQDRFQGQLQDQAPDRGNDELPQGPLLLPAAGDAAAQQVPQQPQYDPGDPNAVYPPADLGPDNEIAQTYDDGYDPQAYTEFQSELAPYGSWSNDPTYGNVWSPYASTVGADFVPYASCGNWIMSEYGWTWVSDWNWGWAPFHYGRWTTIAGRGWSWIPGTMWGPAWVSWRSGQGYVGWSPLPPRGTGLFAGIGGRSPWRFTTAAGLGAARPAFVSSRYLPSMFARTTVVANDRLLTRGQWTVHVNAGPTHGMNAAPVRLANAAPRALPRVAVYPHAGVALGDRPWMRAAAGRPGVYGQGANARGEDARAWNAGAARTSAYGQGWNTGGAHPGAYGQSQRWNAVGPQQHAVGRTPAYGPTAARPGVRAPATAGARPTQSYNGSIGGYGRPYTGGSYAAAARPYAAPSYGGAQTTYRAAAPAPSYYHASAPSYAPAQRSFASPPAAHFGGGNFGGGGSSNFGSGGGSHFGGGGGSHFGGGGGRRR
jgi:hypothetical protein